MVGIATAGSTVGNLLLLPACLTLWQRLAARATRPRRGPILEEEPKSPVPEATELA
jgi:hypothetical protein